MEYGRSNRLVAYLVSVSLGALVFANCAPVSRGPERALGNRCNSDQDCPGAVCDLSQRVCVTVGASTEVVFLASPPGGRTTPTAATTTFDPRTVRGADVGAVNIQLRAPRTVYGSVRAPAPEMSDVSVPVSATVYFRRQGATPSEGLVSVRASATAALVPDGRTVSDGRTYSVQLVPGTYDITVVPDDITRYPPYFITGYQVLADSAGTPIQFDIVYSSLTTVTGTVVDANDPRIALSGLAVQIVDRDGTRISTVSTTDDQGAFQLSLSPGAPHEWALEVSSPSESIALRNRGRLVYRIPAEGLGALTSYSGLQVRVPGALGFAHGGCNRCVTFEATVEGLAPSGAPVVLPQATVDLRAEEILGPLPAGHHAWFEAQVVTETDGSFQVQLLPGQYEAVITPATAGSFAVTALTLPITSEQRGRVLPVRRLVPVRGVVMDEARGTPLGGVRIEAIPFAAALPLAATRRAERLARQAHQVSEPSGNFTLLLDPGRYKIVARPPSGSGFATQIRDEVLVVEWRPGGSNELDTPAIDDDFVRLALRAPIVVRGRVFDAVGDPVGGAFVRAFARIRLGAALSPFDIEIDSVMADQQGGYSLLLPAGLQP